MRSRSALCVILLLGAGLVSCSGSTGRAAPSTSVDLHAPVTGVQHLPKGAAATTSAQGRPPVVPTSGAYFGAWVQPVHYLQPDRIAAVTELEAQLGRRLDIVHTYRTIDEAFPTASDLAAARSGSYLLFSWAMADTDAIAQGRYDGQIRQLAEAVRQFRAPMFMEPRWEMDRPNLASVVHSPTSFIAAWNHVHAIFDQVGTPNASWVWCPTATGFADGRAPAYYPGDGVVDWVCIDAYPGASQLSFSRVVTPFLDWAHQHPKPAMIGEFGVPRSFSPDDRAAWLAGAEATTRADPQVKAVVYFDSGIQSAPAPLDFWLASDAETLGRYRQWARLPYFDVQHLVKGAG